MSVSVGAIGCDEQEGARKERGSPPAVVEFAATPPPESDEVAGISNALLSLSDEPSAPAPAEEPLTINVAQPGPVVVVDPDPVPVFSKPPPLLIVEPNISVVKDNDVPVYYTEKEYWMVRDEGWYHTPRWDQPWAVASVEIVPKVIVQRDHKRYVRFSGGPTFPVWFEPVVRYNGPPIFYDPPPLVSVQEDVYVVEDYEVPVYYTEGHYYQRRNNRWYKTARYNEPWIDIDISIVPGRLSSRRDHDHYVHYRDHKRDHVFREARHARAEARDARADARREARLLRETRVELNRERARLAAERERRVERRRVAKERERQEERASDRRERDRIAAENARERRERDRRDTEKARERRERDRVAADREAKERREKSRVAADRAAKERRERERVAADRAAQERREKGRIANEAKERRDRDRLAAQKAEERRREHARLEASKNKKPVPAAAPREERRRAPVKIEKREAPKVKIIKKPAAPTKKRAPGKERQR